MLSAFAARKAFSQPVVECRNDFQASSPSDISRNDKLNNRHLDAQSQNVPKRKNKRKVDASREQLSLAGKSNDRLKPHRNHGRIAELSGPDESEYSFEVDNVPLQEASNKDGIASVDRRY